MRRQLPLMLLALLVAPGPVLAQDGTLVSARASNSTTAARAPVSDRSSERRPGFDVDYMQPVGDFLPADYPAHLSRATRNGEVAGSEPQSGEHDAPDRGRRSRGAAATPEQDRLLLLGHSWGGMLAMAYAVAHSERVDRLILIGSGGPTLEFAQWFSDNIDTRLRPEDIEARSYWQAAVKNGVDRDKAALEETRAIAPGYFFDRKKGLAFGAALKDGELHSDVNRMLFTDLAKSYDLRART